MAAVDFGTYHHTTPAESKRIRDYAEKEFSRLSEPLYPSAAPIRVLDAGCGLGFLMYVAAKCFSKARIVGADLFKHDSISGISIEKAVSNMKSLGINARTSFLTQDLTESLEADTQFDLALSNLVFHNMGEKRFKGYETVFDVLKPGGYFIIGDLFRHAGADEAYFEERSRLIQQSDAGELGSRDYKIKVLRKTKGAAEASAKR